MRIFISYASVDQAIAEELYHALVQQGHRVFLDSIGLSAGDAYHLVLRKEVARADRMLVLISRAALEPSRYTRTELAYAQQRWPDPSGRVLPVAVGKYNPAELPAYLRSITVLEPSGNLTAAVLQELRPPRHFLRPGLLVATMASLASLGALYLLSEAEAPADVDEKSLRFARVALDPDNPYWEEISPDRPNYAYERARDLAEDDPALAAEFEARAAAGAFACPGLFAHPQRCRQATRFFAQKDLQNEAIDPSFDVLLSNHTGKALLILALAVEIEFAAQITVSLGDWETTRVRIDRRYDIAMPARPPTDVFRVGDTVVDATEMLRDFVATYGEYPSPTGLRAVIGATDYEWTGLPVRAEIRMDDPIFLEPDEPYRFSTVLTGYDSMPNSVLLRLLVTTDRGEYRSAYYYLLAL